MNETSSDGRYLHVRGRSVSSQGFTFYRGRERLEVEEGLAELGDAGLREADARARDAVAGAKTRQQISRPLWIGLMTGGLAATLVGIIRLTSNAQTGVDTGGVVLAGAGLGGMLLATPLLYVDYVAGPKAAEYDMRGQLYIPPPDGRERLEAALTEQRQRAAAKCEPPAR